MLKYNPKKVRVMLFKDNKYALPITSCVYVS